MSIETLAQACADRFAAAEDALLKLEASVKAYQAGLTTAQRAIPPVTFMMIRGIIAGAAGGVANAHLGITPYDVRPRPMDGGGGK